MISLYLLAQIIAERVSPGRKAEILQDLYVPPDTEW